MLLLVQLIGFLIMGFGLTICVLPSVTQKVLTFFSQGENIYYAGLIRLVTGLALIFAAAQSKMPLAAVTLGILFLLSAFLIFGTDRAKIKAFIQQYLTLPELAIRLLGLIAACFGLLIISIF